MPNDKKPIVQIPVDKGDYLEYRISGVFQSQGYLTRRAIPLKQAGNKQDATDIDVLGIIFTAPFQGHRIICDCKNKSKPKPFERVFWAKGLGSFINASEVYVALPKASWDFIQFANQGAVRILTNDLLNNYSKNPMGQYGLADHTHYGDFFDTLRKTVGSNKEAQDCLLRTKQLFLSENPYVSLNEAMDMLSEISNKHLVAYQGDREKEFWKYIICELTVNVAIQVLWICSDTLCFSSDARRNHIRERLTYGEYTPKVLHSILNTAKEMANEIIRSKVPADHLPSQNIVDFGTIDPPDYTEDVIGLVERALSNPDWYIRTPQLLDYLLFEQGLKGKEFSDSAFRSMFRYGWADENLKAARNILSFIRDKIGLNWTTIWPKSEGDNGL